jgi:hypothetical protein
MNMSIMNLLKTATLTGSLMVSFYAFAGPQDRHEISQEGFVTLVLG